MQEIRRGLEQVYRGDAGTAGNVGIAGIDGVYSALEACGAEIGEDRAPQRCRIRSCPHDCERFRLERPA